MAKNDDARTFLISVAAELAGMHAQTLRTYDRLAFVYKHVSYAVWMGSRWTTRQMPVPTRSRVVAAAAADSVTKGSITS